jgi:hypothetical protein
MSIKNKRIKRHNAGDIFIDSKHDVIYTIVEVIPFGIDSVNYRVHYSDRDEIRVINDWWLDDYATKV